METKVLEIRDRGTFIPAMAIRLSADDYESQYLLARAGFSKLTEDRQYTLFINLEQMRVNYDEFSWGSARTMRVAHIHIRKNWDSLKNGDVIDVEFISGETKEKKESERFS